MPELAIATVESLCKFSCPARTTGSGDAAFRRRTRRSSAAVPRRASRRNRTLAEFHLTGRTNIIMRRHGGMFRQTNDHATHSKVRLRRSPWAMKIVGSGARPSRLSPTNPKQDSRRTRRSSAAVPSGFAPKSDLRRIPSDRANEQNHAAARRDVSTDERPRDTFEGPAPPIIVGDENVGSGARPSCFSPTNPKQDSRSEDRVRGCVRACERVRAQYVIGRGANPNPAAHGRSADVSQPTRSGRTRSMIGRLHTARPVRNARLSHGGTRGHMKSSMLLARRLSGLPLARSPSSSPRRSRSEQNSTPSRIEGIRGSARRDAGRLDVSFTSQRLVNEPAESRPCPDFV